MADQRQKRKFRVQLGENGTFDVLATGGIMAVRAAIKASGRVHEAYEVVESSAKEYNVVCFEQGGKNQYFVVKLNTKEPKYCDMSALHQNWFAGMEMIWETMMSQTFFDKSSRCVYVVSDNGEGIQIKEISPSNPAYPSYFK